MNRKVKHLLYTNIRALYRDSASVNKALQGMGLRARAYPYAKMFTSFCFTDRHSEGAVNLQINL